MNSLADETSPYLLQHADNPVDWHPWNTQSLELARSKNRPILLSVGYSACHWCHVMAHESFENAETAALMNQWFINIKVDREERPDLDKIYQNAHSMLTERPGGWPLTVFLTPDDHMPIFAGTYFPHEPRYGMPAFQQLLEQIHDIWLHRQADIEKQSPPRLNPPLNALARTRPATISSTPCRWMSPGVRSNSNLIADTAASAQLPSFRTRRFCSARYATGQLVPPICTLTPASCTRPYSACTKWQQVAFLITSAVVTAGIPPTNTG